MIFEFFDALQSMRDEILQAILETAIMLGAGLSTALIFGIPLGIILFITPKYALWPQPWLYKILSIFVNVIRSFPFVILMVGLVPMTRMIVGTSIGPWAAAIPLSCAAIPYFARLVEQNLREIPLGIIEAAKAMGATPYQIIWGVLLKEARPSLISSFTVLSISFLSYSAVAGIVGGGGIGDLAIRYGYYRFQTDIMLAMVILLIILVQIIQYTGQYLAKKLDHRQHHH
jgi:D-methionine transport system permease protein